MFKYVDVIGEIVTNNNLVGSSTQKGIMESRLIGLVTGLRWLPKIGVEGASAKREATKRK